MAENVAMQRVHSIKLARTCSRSPWERAAESPSEGDIGGLTEDEGETHESARAWWPPAVGLGK